MNEQDRFFLYKCQEGLKGRGFYNNEIYLKRLRYECGIIIKKGYSGYFLIVQDLLKWARDNGILHGHGRGSACGSLASYSLRITNIDPIKWDLYFERFINPSRPTQPDIDIDIAKDQRELVIDYVRHKYGSERVCGIGTSNLQRAKASVRNVARTLGYEYSVGDNLSKQMLDNVQGVPPTIKDSLEKVTSLQLAYATEGRDKKILDWALKVENLPISAGGHAAGVIISNESFLESLPLFVTKDKKITSQWDMHHVEDLGFIKFDFLGLKALTKVRLALEIINKESNPTLTFDNIPEDDKLTFDKLCEGESLGVFQIEGSSSFRDLMMEVAPREVKDIAALVAMYRPGPLGSDGLQKYLKVRKGLAEPEYLIPEMEPILKSTDGFLLMQEQVMRIATDLCGYSLAEADVLRKVMGKKDAALLASTEVKFKKGWIDNGYPEDKVNILFDQLTSFAQYCFNASHSAAYGLLAYQTAYLKVNYPTEYLCALLIAESENQDDVIKIITECKRLNISVKPPDINISTNTFSVERAGIIRFGLDAIKGLGKTPNTEIVKHRTAAKFDSFFDFCDRVDLNKVNKRKVDTLIQSGCFDELGDTRATLIEATKDYWIYKEQRKKYDSSLERYNIRLEAIEIRLTDIADGKLSLKGKKLTKLKVPDRPEAPIYPVIKKIDEASLSLISEWEYSLLGFFVTSHPMDNVSIPFQTTSVAQTKLEAQAGTAEIAGVIANIQILTTKKKTKMAFLRIEDTTGTMEAVCFSRVFSRYESILEKGKPFHITGKIEISKSDTATIVKLIVKTITSLKEVNHEEGRDLYIEIKSKNVKQTINLLRRYKGNDHNINLVISNADQSKFYIKTNTTIGPYKQQLLTETKNL